MSTMLYSHYGYNGIKHPQPQPTKLPSFSELLTSIPLPTEFYTTTSAPVEAPVIPHMSAQKPALAHLSQSMPSYTTDGASVSPKTVLDNQIDIPTPPPTADHTLHSPESKIIRSLSPVGSESLVTSATDSPRSDLKRKYVCKTCARSFTTSGHLARHNRIHTGERKHLCPWPSCDARFARQDNCMQHYKTHTNGKNKRIKVSFKAEAK